MFGNKVKFIETQKAIKLTMATSFLCVDTTHDGHDGHNDAPTRRLAAPSPHRHVTQVNDLLA